jgi:hypothetical protein
MTRQRVGALLRGRPFLAVGKSSGPEDPDNTCLVFILVVLGIIARLFLASARASRTRSIMNSARGSGSGDANIGLMTRR